MVFIVLGAAKAAKHARNEYNKNKKRNTIIAPVAGSHDMMADRAASSQSHPSGSTDWWGTTRAADAPAPTCDASWNPNLVGAWSRDQSIQQRDDGNAARPSSADASSASASTELSAPISPSPHEGSASLSSLDAVKPSSQRSGDMEIPTRPSSMDTPSKPSRGDNEGQLSVSRSSTGLEVVEDAPTRNSPEFRDISGRKSSRREASVANIGLPSKNSEAVVPIKPMEEVERRAGRQPHRAKACAQGSFAEAMQTQTASKLTTSNSSSQPSSETISALARNASKGLRRKTNQTDGSVQDTDGQVSQVGDGTLSALSRNASRDHRKRLGRTAGGVSIVKEKDGSAGTAPIPEMAPQSALARKASKGPRRRYEPLTNGPASLGSAGIDAIGDDGQKGKQENTRLVDEQPKETRTGVSAFAGAPTKKRSKRPSPVYPLKAEALNVASSMGTSDSQELQPEPMRSSTSVTGSSMYAIGTMKKRNSRR